MNRVTQSLPSAEGSAVTVACVDLLQGLEQAIFRQCSEADPHTVPPAIPASADASFQPQRDGYAPLYVELRTLGRLQVAEARTGQVMLSASGERDRPSLIAWIQLDGEGRFAHRERTLEIMTGDLCLLRSARPVQVSLNSGRLLLVAIPEAEVADRFPLWRQALLKRLPMHAGVPAIFVDAVRSLLRWQDGIDEPHGEHLADAVIDLVGAVICCAVPDSSGCMQRSLHQRQNVKRYIQRHLQDPELNAERVARALNLSVRQLHRLFADESLSLMRWIWSQRLEACHRELQRDHLGRRSLADIAFAWGFNDQAHFSRAFRRQFGISPRELRRQRQLQNLEPLVPD